MSDVVTPVQVEQRLRSLGRELDEAHTDMVAAEFRFATAKPAYEIHSAKERLRVRDWALERGVKITVQEIADTAMVNCADEYTELSISEATVRSARANVSRIKTHIDIARSVGTSVRASMEVS